MGKRLIVNWLETGDTRGLYQKFCLMKAAARGEIVFRVWPRSSWAEFGFDNEDVPYFKEGYSFFRVSYDNRDILVILDNKDSFFNISPLIQKADLYFLGAYSPSIIESKNFPTPYSWQTENELAPYRQHFKKVVDQYGEMFTRIVRSIPMPMVMHPPLRRGSGCRFSPSRNILLGCILVLDRWARRRRRPLPLVLEKEMFSIRYKDLLALRRCKLEHDIVASDTLWAWPDHRARLYCEIVQLPKSYRVLTRLSTPSKGESWPERLSPVMLDFVRKQLAGAQAEFHKNYEQLLSESRLNVFACGKHWGWRQICFVALLSGNPIFMDKPLFSPYFSFDDFTINYTGDQWQELPDLLDSLDQTTWSQIKRKNQKIFDQYLAPDAVANYMINLITAQFTEFYNGN